MDLSMQKNITFFEPLHKNFGNETEKLVYFKLNKTNLFKEKWKIFDEKILSNI